VKDVLHHGETPPGGRPCLVPPEAGEMGRGRGGLLYEIGGGETYFCLCEKHDYNSPRVRRKISQVTLVELT